MDWQCGVGIFFISLFCLIMLSEVLLSFVRVPFPIHSHIFTFARFVVLGGSVIACQLMQHHIVVWTPTSTSTTFPMRAPKQEHTSQHAAPQRGLVFAPPPWKMVKRNFDLLCA